MVKIGLTGAIGSGKTTVSKVFEVLGIPVFYADEAAKAVMISDRELIEGIKSAFGRAAYFADGSLNRKYIAAIVFNDKDRLAILNSLVHPSTFRAFDKWQEKFPDAPYVLKEAALLFETDAYKVCNHTITVTAPLDERIKRVMLRDGLTDTEVENRNTNQFSEEKKIALADYTIKNDGSQLVIPQVLHLHFKILSLNQ